VAAFFFAFIAAAAQIPFIWNIIKTLANPATIKPAEIAPGAAIQVPVAAPMAHSTSSLETTSKAQTPFSGKLSTGGQSSVKSTGSPLSTAMNSSLAPDFSSSQFRNDGV